VLVVTLWCHADKRCHQPVVLFRDSCLAQVDNWTGSPHGRPDDRYDEQAGATGGSANDFFSIDPLAFSDRSLGYTPEKTPGSTRSTRWAVDGVTGIHLAMVAAGYGLGCLAGFSHADRIGVGFAGSQKTLVVGLHVAVTHFGGLAILPVVTYQVSQLVLNAWIADRLREKVNPESPAS